MNHASIVLEDIQQRRLAITRAINALVSQRDDLFAAERVLRPLADVDPSDTNSEGENHAIDKLEDEGGTEGEASGAADLGAVAAPVGGDGVPDSGDAHSEPAAPAVAAGAGDPSTTVAADTVGEPPAGEVATPSASPALTLRDRLLALHAEHPEYTAAQAAAALGCPRSSVSAYASMSKIKWATERGEPVKAVDPKKPAWTGEHLPPARPSNPPPKGTRFRLRDRDGLYLHTSGTGMTEHRQYAWEGTGEQLLACRRAFPMARDLSEEIVPAARAA